MISEGFPATGGKQRRNGVPPGVATAAGKLRGNRVPPGLPRQPETAEDAPHPPGLPVLQAARTLKTEYRETISENTPGHTRVCPDKQISHEHDLPAPPRGRGGPGRTTLCPPASGGDPARSGLSEERRGADALAPGADEGRDKLRKSTGRGKCPVIRGCPNGETHAGNTRVPYAEHIGIRGEPGELKHLSSRRRGKKNRFPE